MNYQEAWTFLDNLQFHKIKLGLDTMNLFLGELGRPHHRLRFVHVAGTNGKGSVATYLLSVLNQAGYKVGLFTSPHLSSVRERFRIGNRYIPEEEFARHAAAIIAILQGRQITYFEFTTTLALLWFAEQEVDLAIMEVGMGGRLDATNVVEPLVSVITNVSMDHEMYLGTTLAQIAGEKAGIVKPGVPVVTGAGQDPEDPYGIVLSVIDQRCREQEAPLFVYDRDFAAEPTNDGTWTYWCMARKEGCCKLRHTLADLQLAMRGEHQRQNAAMALAALELLAPHGVSAQPEDIRQGLAAARWPGRLEYFCLDRASGEKTDCAAADRVRYLLDGAHNPAGVATLRQALKEDFRYDKLILVWGAMVDKDSRKSLGPVAGLAHRIILTQPVGERAATPEQLAENLDEKELTKAEKVAGVPNALERARELAGPDDLVCVAGSLYLIGAARALLLGELA